MAAAMAAETARALANNASQGDEQHQALNTRENCTFILGNLTNLLGMRVRNRLLQLEGDGRGIGRAVPAVVIGGAERAGVTARRRYLRAW